MGQSFRILVAKSNERWQVNCAHCDRTWEWELMSEATRSARAHVAALAEGKVREILVQKPEGALEADWVFGEDPFPPER
jgi:hypothetical protein